MPRAETKPILIKRYRWLIRTLASDGRLNPRYHHSLMIVTQALDKSMDDVDRDVETIRRAENLRRQAVAADHQAVELERSRPDLFGG